ncbi:uncharacterized protein METZ01_LOCUS11629 [marine metagenome]|uniref:Uncharacterized protein n=1 Tax=marine metagenome TaxID=408172 RepID=A0A381NVX8_9ZZZZ
MSLMNIQLQLEYKHRNTVISGSERIL